MKYALLAAIIIAALSLTLNACTTVVDAPPVVVKSKKQYADRDVSAEIVLMCDRLGFRRQDEGWRLCALRGMDRYIDHTTPPLSERYMLKNDEMPQYQQNYYVPSQPPAYTVQPVPPASYPIYPPPPAPLHGR